MKPKKSQLCSGVVQQIELIKIRHKSPSKAKWHKKRNRAAELSQIDRGKMVL